MSNIIKSNDTLLMLTDDIRYVNKHGISKDFIERLLEEMIPTKNMQQLIGSYVIDSDYGYGFVAFDPDLEIVEVFIGKLYYWIEKCINVLEKKYQIKDKNELKGYQLIQIIAHEIEHAYQYLMGMDLIKPSNSTVASAYRDIYYLITSNHNPKTRSLYFEKSIRLLLERNAQLESFDLILKCSEYSGRLDIYEAYNGLFNNWSTIGYEHNSDGSILETYHLLKLDKSHLKYIYDVQMSDEEKIKYGFPISNEIRQMILKR